MTATRATPAQRGAIEEFFRLRHLTFDEAFTPLIMKHRNTSPNDTDLIPEALAVAGAPPEYDNHRDTNATSIALDVELAATLSGNPSAI